MHADDYLINRDEALRYLHWQKALPEANEALFNQAEQLFLAAANPRYFYKIYPKEELKTLLSGEDIKKHLAQSQQVVLLAATLGSEVDSLIRRTQVADMALSVIIDALASAAIEEVCDLVCDELEEKLAPLVLTSRFSPGYGDWHLEKQDEFLRILGAGKAIGLCVNSSLMLTPIKSVTAAIGLQPKGQAKVKTKHDCSQCNLYASCQYRKGGTTCGD